MRTHIATMLASTAAWLCFSYAQSAGAGIVYQQPTVWTGNGTSVGSSWTSHEDTTLTGFRTNDNFSLASAAVINQVSWWGIYIHPDFTNASPNTTDWIIRFQADNAGIPGTVLSSETILDNLVTRQSLGTGLFNGNTVDVYRFTAPFPNFGAAAATTYWFSPLSRDPTFDPLFSWIQGTGGDNASFQTQFTNGAVINAIAQPGDRAFQLASVPEPGTLALIGVAIAGLGFSRRRALD